MEAAVVPVFKRGNHAAVSNYRHIFILSIFSTLSEFIIHNHVVHYVKLNRNQYGFTTSKSTITNLVTFLDFMTPVVRGQRQADAVYFDLSDDFDLVPNNLLLHKLSSFGLSDDYVGWFCNYLTNRQSRIRVSVTLSLLFQITFVCRKALFWGLYFSTYSLMAYVTLLYYIVILTLCIVIYYDV
jgi:hypothetical protein